MENQLLSEILNMASKYPNDSELGKNIRIAVRKYRDLIVSSQDNEISNKNISNGPKT